VLSLCESEEENQHSSVITLLIQRCATEAGVSLAELDAVAVSEGPGSYTSLRVGFSTSKSICYTLGKPLITVSTLAALANAAFEEVGDATALYCPMLDARRMEVYTALYTAEGQELRLPYPMVVDEKSSAEIFTAGKKIVFCGNGMEKCKTLLNNPLSVFSKVKKCNSLQIISPAINAFLNKNFANTAYAIPAYLKPPNITTPRQNLANPLILRQ
jgi:tRNA threonylcarbamoyladenosine biosynthesis protein TsaB